MKTLLPIALLLLLACDRQLVCPQGEADCDGRCVDLMTDPRNCGACGAAVGLLEVCAAATATCAPGIASCDATCTDTARDPDNCGDCGVPCLAEQYCTTEGGTTGCTDACPAGFTPCDRACVDPLADRFNCGACGVACAPGQACRDGACRADLQVACYATTEVVPVTADLAWAGDSRVTPSGPTSIALHGGAVYAANGYPSASVSVLPLDPALPSVHQSVTGDDLQHVAVLDGLVLVSNASVGSLLFLTPAGDVIDELAMPDQASYPNPHGFAFVGSSAYVALYGSGEGNGQSMAKLDLSTLAACAADGGATSCGSVVGELDLAAVAGTSDAPGLPFPSAVVEAGGRIYVTLANLKEASFSCGDACSYTAWAEPAGHGRLAVIDPAAADAVSVVDLGAGCGNPGALAVDGTTLWVSCGSWSFPATAPGALLPVDLSGASPAVGTPLDVSPAIPGRLAFCGGVGYATDQASGAVIRFDPEARTVEDPVEVCPMGPWGFAWASDVACGH
jgi:hypothetical protein